MALHNKRVKRITHHEYELPSPVHISEFLKTLVIAQQDVKRDLGDVADEVIEVKAHDDKVLITWWSEEDV
ncbi:hypothetical protein [Micromonospora sp. L32]|uniref:hypothetical protein n=1 Tax=Micromonospora sp. L32 TaxID=3452214 RepID=UPI003F8BD885